MQAEPQHIDWDKLIDLLEKTPAERDMLVATLPDGEQVLFAQLQQWKEDALLSGALQLDTAQAWKQTLSKMDKQKATVRSVSFRWQRWVSAACLLLVAGAAWFFWLQTRVEQPRYQNIAQALAGHAPSGKVQLVTADGRTVEVDSARQLKEKDGTVIELQQGGVAYANSHNQAPMTPGNTVLTNTLIVPRGYMYSLSLSDGSKVWLNADSKITFPVHFDKTERNVTIEGEAYFEVVHNAKWPFTVHTGQSAIQVLGTSFDVKAYGKNIYTTLVTGSVVFTPPAAAPVRLTPDHQTVFNSIKGTTETSSVIAGDWIAWKDDDLVMVKMSLAELADILERRYDVQVSFTEEKLKDIQYNGALHLTGNVVDMLSNLEQTGNIHFAVKDKKILILPASMK